MIETNKEAIVKISLQGKVHHPFGGSIRIDSNGNPTIVPAIGGIVYNVKIGDSAFGWKGDHIEPGVSIRNEDKLANEALNTFSCIGNEASVITIRSLVGGGSWSEWKRRGTHDRNGSEAEDPRGVKTSQGVPYSTRNTCCRGGRRLRDRGERNLRTRRGIRFGEKHRWLDDCWDVSEQRG